MPISNESQNNHGTMIRLLLLWVGLPSIALSARSPKIYNALITTDEHLQPSQAFPIIEPVLRTTAVGVAPLFQPIVVHQTQPQQPQQLQDKSQQGTNQQQTNHVSNQPQISYHDSYPLYPVSYDPYFQHGYHHNYFYSPPFPYFQQPVYVDYTHGNQQHQTRPPGEEIKVEAEAQIQAQQTPSPSTFLEGKPTPSIPVLPPKAPQTAPPHIYSTNFKKNPEIPDVIPPLPVALKKAPGKKDKRNFIRS